MYLVHGWRAWDLWVWTLHEIIILLYVFITANCGTQLSLPGGINGAAGVGNVTQNRVTAEKPALIRPFTTLWKYSGSELSYHEIYSDPSQAASVTAFLLMLIFTLIFLRHFTVGQINSPKRFPFPLWMCSLPSRSLDFHKHTIKNKLSS